MSTIKSILSDNATVEQVFKALETDTTALFEHLEFSFLFDYPVFAPIQGGGRTRIHQPPELLKGILHCYYHDISGPRPMAREFHNEDVWRQCGFTRLLGRWTLERFITDFAFVAEDVFITLVHELTEQVPFGKLYRIDGTDIPVDQQDDAGWNYDHAEDDFYYGYGCCLVTAADSIPVAATFTPAKKIDQETAMRVTSDALAVEKPIWMLGDAEFDMLDWHDCLLEKGVVPVAPYNQRNAADPLDIEYRVEDTIAVTEERLDEAALVNHHTEVDLVFTEHASCCELRTSGRSRGTDRTRFAHARRRRACA